MLGLAISGALIATPAWADCSPQVADGVTATCTGTTTNQGGGAPGTSAGTDGYGTGVETGVTVNVNSGAANTITGANNGINLGDATVINKAGGTIAGGQTGIYGVSGFADVTNSGTITGTSSYGVIGLTDATVINTAGATITGGQTAIYGVNGFANVTNSGSITGTADTGISANTDATVINAAGASITGGQYGIVANRGFADVTNSGIITGTLGAGISANINATVTNTASGNITGGDYGILSNTGSVNVTNSGSITGTAVFVSAGIFAGADATVINNANAIIMGDAYGIRADAGSANVTNSGSITAPGGNAISAGTRAMVTNNAGASITGGFVGIFAGSANSSIFNAGTIRGPHAAIQFLDGGSSVFNAGTISSDFTAIRFANTGNTLTLAQGSVITGDVLGGGSDTFQLGGIGAATFDVSALGVQYQGFGTFNKIDSSVWTLTGTSTFNGDVNVNAGTLVVNGDITSASGVTVNAGVLAGSGTVGNATINAGGTFSPGNGTPGSSMTVTSLALQSGAQYMVSLNNATSSFANVTGNATLGGLARVTSPTGNYRFNSAYTILTTQGGLGGTTFGSLATPTGIGGVLSYTSNDVLLTLTSQLGQTAGLYGNQQQVAHALDAGFNSGANINGLGAIFGGNVPQNLTQVSGELGTGSQQTAYQAMNLFMGLITDPFSAGRGVPNNGPTAFADEESMAYEGRARSKNPNDAFAAFTKAPPAVFAQRWNVWAAGYGGSQTTDGNAVVGSNNTRSSVYGGVAGADYWFSPDTVAGFALAGGGSNFSVANGGTGRSDMFQAGAFVRHNFDATYLTASVAYGWQDVTTDRYVSVAGVDHLRANFNANAYSGRLELGHRFLTPWFGGLGVSPYAAAQITAFELPSYNERAISGVSTFALNYGGDTTTASRTELGLRSDKSFALDGAVLTLRGRAAWAHDFDPNSAVSATFQTLPGASFVVNGAALASDSALTTASAEVRWLNGWSVAGTFEGEFSNVTRSYAGKGVVRYNW